MKELILLFLIITFCSCSNLSESAKGVYLDMAFKDAGVSVFFPGDEKPRYSGEVEFTCDFRQELTEPSEVIIVSEFGDEYNILLIPDQFNWTHERMLVDVKRGKLELTMRGKKRTIYANEAVEIKI